MFHRRFLHNPGKRRTGSATYRFPEKVFAPALKSGQWDAPGSGASQSGCAWTE